MEKVLITGGSEGIGFALAQAYARQGASLFLVARDMAKLQKAQQEMKAAVPVRIVSCDLSEAGVGQKLFDLLKAENIDTVINNAGCGQAGAAVEIPVEKDEKMLYLNCTSLMTLTKLFASQMKQRRSGMIVNVASTGAFQPGPYIASYYASKAFVLSYTRALREELKDTGVKVCCLCPGPVDTAFYSKSGNVMSRFHISPEACAAFFMKHKEKQAVIVPGFLNRLVLIIPASLKMKWIEQTKKIKK